MDNKYAFVHLVEHHPENDIPCFFLIGGEYAEDRESLIKYWAVPVTIIVWFAVPDLWPNVVSYDCVNEVFEAIVGLDALGDNSAVSDLLTTIFAAGFECGKRSSKPKRASKKKVQTA